MPRPKVILYPFKAGPLDGKNWKETLDTGIKELKDFNWQLGFGTLLGMVRDKTVIPHDLDLDIDVMMEDEYKPNTDALHQSYLTKGFRLIKMQEWGGLIMSLAYMHEKTNVIFDICFFYGIWGDDFLHLGSDGIVIRPRWTLKTIKLLGYNIPERYDDYLTGRYDDWRTPVSGKKDWFDYANKYFIKYD